jgi:transcriptional regulator with XRE-family HTH domain
MSISAEVGLKIKAYRQRLNLTLKDIEARVDVSATHVSEIERGKTSPTIGALQKLAVALERDVAYFLETEALDEVAHQRAYERTWHLDGERGRWTALSPRIPGSRLSAYRMELEPGAPLATVTAGDSDDVYLVDRGVVRFECADEVHDLRAGDSIHLRGGTAYRFVNAGPEVAAMFQFSGYRRTMPAGFTSATGPGANGNGDQAAVPSA